MSREHFYKSIRDDAGALMANASVRVLQPGTAIPIIEDLYVDDTGTGTYDNPRVVPTGVIDFYLAKPKIVDIEVTPAGALTPTLVKRMAVGDTEVYRETLTLTMIGATVAGANLMRFYFEEDCTVLTVRTSVGVPPAGSALVVDVNLNGASIFTAQGTRPMIAPGTYTVVAVPQQVDVAAGDYMTVDVDEVGSSAAGSDLVVQIRVSRTD